MIIGPFIGAAVIRGNGQTYVELGQSKTVPTPAIFLAAAIALLLVAVPLLLLRREAARGQVAPQAETADEGEDESC